MSGKIRYIAAFYIPVIFIAVIIFSSCDENEAINQKIEFKVKEKLSVYKRKRLKKCKDKALEDAEIYVDSIIAEITKNAVYKDLDFPERPARDTSVDNYELELDSFELDKIVDSLKKKE